MKITGPAPPTTTISQANAKDSVNEWRIGQILNANIEAQAGKDTLMLRIGSLLLEARTTLPLATNQTLLLEVTQTGEQPTLRVLQVNPGEHPINSAMRTILPQQVPLGPILKSLPTLLASLSTSGLSPLALQLLAQLLNNIPSVASLVQPELLKQALRNSGLFLEGKLALADSSKNSFDAAADFKAGLLRLLAALQQSDGSSGTAAKLTTHIESALARVQLNQLSSIPQDTQTTAWIVELPLRNGENIDVMRLHVEKEASSRETEEDQAKWCIWLTFELEALGPLFVRLTLHNGHVSVNLWVERAETLRTAENYIKQLWDAFQGEGLNVLSISCRQGRPTHPAILPLKLRLLDTNA